MGRQSSWIECDNRLLLNYLIAKFNACNLLYKDDIISLIDTQLKGSLTTHIFIHITFSQFIGDVNVGK